MSAVPASLDPEQEQHRSRSVLVAILAFLLGGLTVALLYQLDVFGGSSSSTTVGSGVAATQARDLPGFTGVELAGRTTS